MEERLLGLKYTLAAPGLHYRFTPTDEDIAACVKLGEQVADALVQDTAFRISPAATLSSCVITSYSIHYTKLYEAGRR